MKQILDITITAEDVRVDPQAEGADAFHHRQPGRPSFFLSRGATAHALVEEALDRILVGDRKTIDCAINRHSSPRAARSTHPEAHGDERKAQWQTTPEYPSGRAHEGGT